MKQYRDLVDWVYRVTQQRTPPSPEELRPGESPASTALNGEPAAGINLDDVLPLRDNEVEPATFVQDLNARPNSVVVAGGAMSTKGSRPLQSGENSDPPPGNSSSVLRFPVGQFLRQIDSSPADVQFTFGDPSGNSDQERNAPFATLR